MTPNFLRFMATWVPRFGVTILFLAGAANASASTLLSIDAPAPGSTVAQPFLLGGWALDTGATSGTGVLWVSVYAYPNGDLNGTPIDLGIAPYGGDLDLIRFGGHLPKGGYDVRNGRNTKPASAPAVHG